MDIDIRESFDAFQDGAKETAETMHEKTSEFHRKYVSKHLPNCGKYGDEAKFLAEMLPGVSEYNAIREGDWQAFAISAGIDAASIAVAAFSFGAGYAAVKGGATAAKAGAKVTVKEITKLGAKKAAKETAEVTTKKVVRETAEATTKKIVKETAETTTKKVAKETAEASAKRATKETTEAVTNKATKEIIEEGVERTEKTILKVGDKIDTTHFKEYLDEIVKKTNREIQPKQRKLIDKALKSKEFKKLDQVEHEIAERQFGLKKSKLIEEWEQNTGQEWPRYTEKVFSKNGTLLRDVGDPYDAHHIIEKSAGGPNEWWNLHPAKFPIEHQQGIHAADSWASKIFG